MIAFVVAVAALLLDVEEEKGEVEEGGEAWTSTSDVFTPAPDDASMDGKGIGKGMLTAFRFFELLGLALIVPVPVDVKSLSLNEGKFSVDGDATSTCFL